MRSAMINRAWVYATRMSLSVQNISFCYSKGNPILHNISLDITDNEIVALVGRSGSGKSTFLHCISGLLTPTSGSILVDGSDVTKTKIHARGIGIMMQDQPLYDHLTVEKNISFPLIARGQLDRDVSDLLDTFGLATLAAHKVSKCSGGERRRIAFARAVVLNPAVLLIDEPFVSIDDALRSTMQQYIRDMAVTTLLVTHQITDAKAVADRIIDFSCKGTLH